MSYTTPPPAAPNGVPYRSTVNDAIEVLQAYKEGKNIERYCCETLKWVVYRYSGNILQDLISFKMRVKPEPMEIWVNVYQGGYHYGYDTKSEAGAHLSTIQIGRTTKFREVLE